ncbi:hypothetical protein E2C01_086159 [Portunus trituberculatus]|uniref:Uncharacterized protein n=1 Tax=Portunus trituberculatus TaxID=210409 RepID=A0A5B7J4Q2_PORTR|nr:hypothetical protein [Portunus trituberculatus]
MKSVKRNEGRRWKNGDERMKTKGQMGLQGQETEMGRRKEREIEWVTKREKAKTVEGTSVGRTKEEDGYKSVH